MFCFHFLRLLAWLLGVKTISASILIIWQSHVVDEIAYYPLTACCTFIVLECINCVRVAHTSTTRAQLADCAIEQQMLCVGWLLISGYFVSLLSLGLTVEMSSKLGTICTLQREVAPQLAANNRCSMLALMAFYVGCNDCGSMQILNCSTQIAVRAASLKRGRRQKNCNKINLVELFVNVAIALPLSVTLLQQSFSEIRSVKGKLIV